MKKTILALALAAGLASAEAATFGTGANQFTLDFTAIGNTTQAADPTTGYGAVGYNYAMGTYDISQTQLAAAATASGQNFGGGAWTGSAPAANVTWYQAAAFVNWLNTSAGSPLAYQLSGNNLTAYTSGQLGYNAANPFRNSLALYVLPTMDEWYKSAYGLSNGSGYTQYATGSNIAPTAVKNGTAAGTAVYGYSYGQGPSSVYAAGGLSSYGTMGQSGNILQWSEDNYTIGATSANGNRGITGGAWFAPASWLQSTGQIYTDPQTGSYDNVGFRVAMVTANAVPEPSTYALCGLGALALIVASRRRNKTATGRN